MVVFVTEFIDLTDDIPLFIPLFIPLLLVVVGYNHLTTNSTSLPEPPDVLL